MHSAGHAYYYTVHPGSVFAVPLLSVCVSDLPRLTCPLVTLSVFPLICTPAKAVFLVGSHYLISVMHIILKRRLHWVIIMWSRFFLSFFLYACSSPVFPSGFWFCSIKAVKPLACQKHAEGTCCSELCKWQVKCNSRSLPEWMMDVLSTKNGFQTLFINVRSPFFFIFYIFRNANLPLPLNMALQFHLYSIWRLHRIHQISNFKHPFEWII